MKKVTWAIIVGVVLILIFIVAAFFYLALASPSNQKQELLNPTFGVSLNEVVIEEQHVSYVLNEIGAYKLHNMPLTGEKPIIEVKIEDEVFNCEISSGKIKTTKGNGDSPDLRIISTRQEIMNALNSSNIKESVKNSVVSGEIDLEIVGGYTTLFQKGYLSLYQDLTGKSISGGVIKIFEG